MAETKTMATVPCASHRLPGDTGRVACRRDEAGQSAVEFALVLPVIILLVAVAFNGWSALQSSIRLATAARAGAIAAANDLGPPNNKSTATALADATTAINNEEGVAVVYQHTNAAANNYVSLSTSTDTLSGTGVTINVVTINIAHQMTAWVPVVSIPQLSTRATARYS
jgi:Flp pilus assembly protein TadG